MTEKSMSAKERQAATYDAVVVGGGHNGLVAAAYLAKAGLRILVLERRSVVGGAAVTEELIPGFKFSTLADGAGNLSPKIVADLDLNRHGLEILPTDPLLISLQPDGNHLTIWHDTDHTVQEIAKFSPVDAEAYPAFTKWMVKIGGFVAEMNNLNPPDMPDLGLSDLQQLSGFLGPISDLGWKHLSQVIRLLPMSVSDVLNEWFQSEVLKAAIAASAVLHASAGPWEINSTAYAFLYNWAMSNNGLFRSSGQIRGGMGALTQALASSAQSHGAEILTDAEVASINMQDGRVRGVTLENGDQIPAETVISGTDARTTFLKLVDPYYLDPKIVSHVKAIKYRGTMARVHFALSKLPEFSGINGSSDELLKGRIQISPSMEYIQRAYDPVKYGSYSERPYLDMQIPTLTDPSLAPEGKHILSVSVKCVPYELREGSWDEQAEAISRIAISTLKDYASGFEQSVDDFIVITPLDMEKAYSLPEGSPSHGEMSLDQFMWMRPIPGYAQYRAPIAGLYMCSASTHPGGGVTGLGGRNACRQILRDLK
jgi:phytoene dehydrogenase-like protein